MTLSRRTDYNYSNKIHANSTSYGIRNYYVLNTNTGPAEIRLPNCWEEGVMFFRPFPHPNPENPNLPLPGRNSNQNDDHTPWYVVIEAAKHVGVDDDNKYTWLLYPPHVANAHELRNRNPYIMLYWACYSAKQGKHGSRISRLWHDSWNEYVEETMKSGGGKKGQGGIPVPSKLYFLQGAIYVNGDKSYIDNGRTVPLGLDPSDPLQVIQLSVSAGKSLATLADMPKVGQNNQVILDRDGNPQRVINDIVGTYDPNTGALNGGAIIGLFNPNGKRPYVWRFNDVTTYVPPRPGVRQVTMAMYHCGAVAQLQIGGKIFTASLKPEEMNVVKSKWQWWFPDESGEGGILKFPSREEQMVYICRALRPIAGIVRYALGDQPDLWTSEVNSILGNAVSFVGNHSNYQTQQQLPNESELQEAPYYDSTPQFPQQPQNPVKTAADLREAVRRAVAAAPRKEVTQNMPTHPPQRQPSATPHEYNEEQLLAGHIDEAFSSFTKNFPSHNEKLSYQNPQLPLPPVPPGYVDNIPNNEFDDPDNSYDNETF